MQAAANLVACIFRVEPDSLCIIGVGPADVAALAIHIMTNTALTGATYDIDGGQQFV